MLPRRILVSKHQNLRMLEPIASTLNIELEMAGILKAVEEFREELYAHFLDVPVDLVL